MKRLAARVLDHAVHQAITDLRAAVDAIPGDTAEQVDLTAPEGTLSRVRSIMDYLEGVLAAADPALIAEAPLDQLAAAITQVRQYAETVAETPAQVGPLDQQLDAALVHAAPLAAAVQLTPDLARRVAPALGRALAQKVREIEADAAGMRAALQQRREEWDAAQTEVTGADEQRATELRAQAEQLQTAVTTEKQRLDQLVPQFQGQFTEAQDTRQERFDKASEDLEAKAQEVIGGVEVKAAETIERLDTRSLEIVEKATARGADVEKLYGVITDRATAGAFAKNADAQEEAADNWRWVAFGSGVATLLLAIGTVVASLLIDDFDTGTTIAGVIVSVAAGGLTAYAAKQSGHHRDREEQYRQLELELTAFGPFTESLTEPDAARSEYAERLFRGVQPRSGGRTRKDQVTLPQAVLETLVDSLRNRQPPAA